MLVLLIIFMVVYVAEKQAGDKARTNTAKDMQDADKMIHRGGGDQGWQHFPRKHSGSESRLPDRLKTAFEQASTRF